MIFALELGFCFMKKWFIVSCICFFANAVFGQGQPLGAAFFAAYNQYPALPAGLLESMAYSATRFTNVIPDEDDLHHGPGYYGLFGLVENGHGYFNENLNFVLNLSGITKQQFLQDESTQIMAVAKAINYLRTQKNIGFQANIESYNTLLKNFSDIPTNNNVINLYAQDVWVYEVMRNIQDGYNHNRLLKQPQSINWMQLFPQSTYDILRSPHVIIINQGTNKQITNGSNVYVPPTTQSTDYPPALWVAANSSNYSSRNGTSISAVTIHTVQGTYASCISWFQNPAASVSAHYVVRSSDGQVTQMVLESNKAWHVGSENPYTVGIEHEGYAESGNTWYTNAMYQASAALVSDICLSHGINRTTCYNGPATSGLQLLSSAYKIKGHQHYPNQTHTDPGPYWNWSNYYNLINGVVADVTPPTTSITTNSNWQYQNFNASFNDQDNVGGSGVDNKFYQVIDWNGTEWRGNATKGFFNDNFDNAIHPEWTITAGTWGSVSRQLKQSNQSVANTNIYAPLTQVASNSYLYSWSGKVEGSGTNRRFGLHFFADSAAKSNRGNSYLAWFRVDQGKVELYKTVNDVLNVIYTINNVRINPSTWYDFKVAYDPTKGKIDIYMNNSLLGSYTDSSPLTSGNYISLRNGDCETYFEDLKVRKSRGSSVIVTIGAGQDVRYESPDSVTESCRINTTVVDNAGNWSSIVSQNIFVTFNPACGTPQNLTTTNITTTNATLNWSGVVNATNYTIEYKPSASPTWLSVTTTSLTSIVLNGLTANQTYNWRVKTNCPWGGSSYATAIFSTTYIDNVPPTTQISVAGTWQYQDFTANFTDQDNYSGVVKRFYQVLDWNGSEWRANPNRGFFNDNFNTAVHPSWSSTAGTWAVNSGQLKQTNQSVTNTNLYTSLAQNASTSWLYTWSGKMEGSGTNRRFGFHFFADSAAKSNRGNSYLVWFRADQDKIEIYKTVNDVLNTVASINFPIDVSVWYQFKVTYNPTNGLIEVFIDNELKGSYTDPTPLTNGNFISLRNGDCEATFDDVKVYKSRSTSATITLGVAGDVRYESPDSNTYACKINSIVQDGAANWSAIVAQNSYIVFNPTCGNPTGLANSNLTTTSATCSWNSVVNANAYRFEYRQVGTATWTAVALINPTYNLSSLTSGTTYEWRVRTSCPWGNSAFATSSFTTISPCTTPSNLTASGITITAANLSWAVSPSATSYTLRYKKSANTVWTTVSGVAVNSYALSGLAGGTTYNWEIMSVCNAQNSAYTASSFTTYPVCNPASNLVSSAITASGVTLSWATTNANNYTLRYKPTAGSTWTSVTVNSGSYVVSGLTPATAYMWEVRSNCTGGSSGYVTGSTFTTYPICNAASNLITSSITSSGVTLSWTTTNANNYTLRYKPTGGQSWTSVTVSSVPYVISGLTASTAYTWEVRSNCTRDSSSYVTGSTFTTLPPCLSPTSLSVTYLSTQIATLNWNTVSGATSYSVQYKPSGGSWTTVTTSNTTYSLTGLSASTIYNWQVASVCSGQNSSYTTDTFTTKATCYDAYESNNSSVTSTALTPSIKKIGKICAANDVDWFVVTLPSTTNLRVTASKLPFNINMEHYVGGTYISGSYNSGTTNEVVARNNLPAGNYYYRLYAAVAGEFDNSLDYEILAETSVTPFKEEGIFSPDELSAIEKPTQFYPNPTDNWLNCFFTLDNPGALYSASYTITDLQGATVFQQSIPTTEGANHQILDVGNLANGLYFVTLQIGERKERTKIIIQR